jgi:hypothetical protein
MWAAYGNTMVLGDERVVNESVSPSDSGAHIQALAVGGVKMKTQAARMALVPG